MKLKSLERWTNLPDCEAELFFAQRLDELLFDYTLDTHKAPALNAPSLCAEALSLISDIESENIDSSNLDHVLAELEWSLRSDETAKKLIESDDISSFFLGEQAKNQLAKQKILLEILKKSIAPDLYLYALQENLLDAISKKEKKKIDNFSRSWATTLLNMGMSKPYLHKLVNDFFFGQREISATADVKAFFMSALPFSHSFDVYFLVKREIKIFDQTLSKFNISILDEIPADLVELATREHFAPEQDEVLVEVAQIHALDIHSGRKRAEKSLERVRDLVLLHSHKRPILWREQALVKQCCLDAPLATKPFPSATVKISDLRPSIAAPRISYLIENLSLEEGKDADRFDRIVDLHALCLLQDAPDSQLLSLWICIESLIPSEPSRNKIVNIIETATPILMLKYVHRLIKNLLRDLFEWNKPFVKSILRKIDIDSEEWLALKTLYLLTPEGEPLRREIYANLNEFPLLRYRIFSLSEIFSDPKKNFGDAGHSS